MKGQAYDKKDRWWGGTRARALGLSEFPGGRGCVFRPLCRFPQAQSIGASKDLQDARSSFKNGKILNRRLLLKPAPNPWTQAPLQAQNVPKPKSSQSFAVLAILFKLPKSIRFCRFGLGSPFQLRMWPVFEVNHRCPGPLQGCCIKVLELDEKCVGEWCDLGIMGGGTVKGQAYDKKDSWWGGTRARALGLSEFPGGQGCVFRPLCRFPQAQSIGASKDLQDARSSFKNAKSLTEDSC